MLYSFRYEVKNAKGEISAGEIMAVDLEDAKAKLRAEGLDIRNIHAQIWKKSAPGVTPFSASADGKKRPASFKSLTWPGKVVEPITYSSRDLRGVYVFLTFGFLVLLGFILFPTFFGPKLGLTAINKNVEFKIVKFNDLSENDVLRKGYVVVVSRGIKKEEVKYLAQKIFDQQKAKTPRLDEGMFQFFYPDQDYNMTEPVATLLWNWEGSGAWENTFSLAKETGKEKTQLEQVRLVKGEYVEYNATISTEISLDGVQRVANTELAGLEEKWKGKVPRIKLRVTYQDFNKPVMKCEKSLPAKGPAPAAECDYVQ